MAHIMEYSTLSRLAEEQKKNSRKGGKTYGKSAILLYFIFIYKLLFL